MGKALILDPLVGDSVFEGTVAEAGLLYDPLVAPSPSDSVIVQATGKEVAAFGSAYEGTSHTSREFGFESLWGSPMLSADGELMPDKQEADLRTRDFMRNDAYVRNGVTVGQDSIVGERFLLNAKPSYKVLGLDEVWAEEFQEEVEEKFTLWAEGLDNFADASRMQTLTGMVRMIVGIHYMAGESLASVEWLRESDRPFNTCMQLIDLDRLSNPQGEPDSKYLRGGVAKNIWGAPVGYNIRMAHPGDSQDPDQWQWKYVNRTKPWGRVQMLHMVDQWRPDQSRGVSMMVTALKETKMGRRYRDIVLQNAVLNATYAASIESDLPQEVAMAQAGGGDPAAITKFAEDYLGAIAKYTKGSRNASIDGVKIPVFFPGTTMKLQSAGTPGGLGTNFEDSTMRYTAAALGLGHSEFSKNFSQANYSSLRAEMAGTGRRMRVQKRMSADRFAGTMFSLWLEEALNKKMIDSMPRKAPNFYEGQNKAAYCNAEWIGANMGQIDELKETQAAVLRMNNGLSTMETELGKLGQDWRVVLRQKKREQKMIADLGLVLGADKTTQNTANAASGTPTDEGNAPRGNDTGEEKDE